MAERRPLYVTRPEIAPLQELLPLLEDMWSSRILSNEGPYHDRFERALGDYLGVDHVSLVTNATAGLLVAIRQAALRGEVITTPFSFVGTSHALALAGLQPVFADIDPVSLNLDPAAIEAAVTPATTAIMPVHVFGRACDTAAIEAIAHRHGLKVIYDAAHAFGVHDDGGSILRHGDLSVLSFHATKVFNTFEGGAVISRDAATKAAVDELRNFGIVDELTVTRLGLNAKMHEFSAALGLLQLQFIDGWIEQRGRLDAMYRELLAPVAGIECPAVPAGQTLNHYSFPILVTPDAPFSRDALYENLRAHEIYARRYFYPLISDMPMYSGHLSAAPDNLPVAQTVAAQVLCLPLFPDLGTDELQQIVDIIASTRPSVS